MKASNRIALRVLWVAIIVAPLVSVAIIGLASGTNPLAIDAWNTHMNDERSYYWAITQMREFGAPSGFTGYNEQTAPNLSFGPYNLFVYIPYYVASFLTPIDSHNFMYLINLGFGVLATALIVVLLKPNMRQSALLLSFFLLQFVTSSYLCSGMSEGSYVAFAGLMAGLLAFCLRRDRARSSGAGGAASHSGVDKPAVFGLVLMMVAVCFWGCMRPFLFAFSLVPCILVFVCDYGLRGKMAKLALLLLQLALIAASLVFYVYYSKYYVTPYFNEPNIGASIGSRLVEALPGLAAKHVECIAYSAAKLFHLNWQGIMVFTFALSWFVLLALLVRKVRAGDKPGAWIAAGLLVAAFAIFEAHLLLYTYVQMHRTLIAVNIILVVAIIWLAGSEKLRWPRAAATLTVAATCVLCVGSLAIGTDNFALPQQDATYTAESDQQMRATLAAALPQSDDQWDNTIAKLVETGGQRLYFNMPRYLTTNGCTRGYMESALKKGAFKSKYVCLLVSEGLNKSFAQKYPVVYQDETHIIYCVR